MTKGHPVATELTTLTDMKMLPLSDSVIKGMVEKHGWVEAVIPPNTFKGQTAPVKTVKAATNVLIREGVSDDVAYITTKTIIENAAKLRLIHAGLSNFDPKGVAKAGLIGNCPFHPRRDQVLQRERHDVAFRAPFRDGFAAVLSHIILYQAAQDFLLSARRDDL